MDSDRDRKRTQRVDRRRDRDLALVHREAFGGQHVGDVGRGHAAEELVVFAGEALKSRFESLNPFRQGGRLGQLFGLFLLLLALDRKSTRLNSSH